jgi:glucosamine-6-phosphate deaminase
MSTSLRTFKVDALQVEVYRDETDLVNSLVQHTQSYLSAVIDRQGSAAAILASGASQIKLLKELTTIGEIDWGRITLFHLDEYLGIGGTHPASFQTYMREMVAEKVAGWRDDRTNCRMRSILPVIISPIDRSVLPGHR